MSRTLRYSGLSALVVLAGFGVAAPFLDTAGRNGLMVAGGIAVAIQGCMFAALHRLKDREHGFLLALLGGAAARFGAVGITGAIATNVETGLGIEPLILGLAAFLFVLLMLEALYVRGSTDDTRTE